MNALVHVATIQLPKLGRQVHFLRRQAPDLFVWTNYNGSSETPTDLSANSYAEAVRLAAKKWKNNAFTTLNCGKRFTLPERDEHGAPALFSQMASSYLSPNGVYQDDEWGTCIVNQASQEALALMRDLKNTNLL